MALPLKSGADLYTQELLRAALQNEGSDLTEYIYGSIYFNTNSAGSNSSNRIRYRGLDTWHSVANYEDIEHLQNQIDNIDFASSEEFTSLKERVDAFLDGGVDSDDVLNNLKEIQAFLDAYDGATSLVDLLNAKADKEEFDSAIASITANFANYRLLTNGVFDVLINANQGIETNEITIGGIKLSVVDGHLCIDGDAYTTGQLASGGVAEDGGTSGGSGIVILEDWALLDDTQPQVVGAALGKDMYDRLGVAETNIEELIGRATNVSFSQTLTSGKEIGIIYVDEEPTTLYAPATYSWSDITDKPSDIVDVSSIRSIAESALAKNSFDVLHAASINSDVVSTERLYADSLNGFTPITTGNYSSYALPLSGGTRYLTSTDNDVLVLTTKGYHSTIKFNNAYNNSAIIGYHNNYGAFVYNGSNYISVKDDGTPTYNDNTLIHTGNIGDYAIGYTSNKVSIDTARHSIGYDNGSVGTTNLPFSGGYISADVGSYGMQLLGAYNGNGLLYRGINNNTFTDWKTIAFTDSDISGNLVGTYIGTRDNETNPYLWLQENGGTMYYVQSYNGLLHLGPGATSSLIINSSGNVTIGSSDFARENVKLYVDGGALFEIGIQPSIPTKPSELNKDNLFSLAYADYSRFGLHAWIYSDGQANIQATYADNENDNVYALNLNPLGGAVNVGGGGLNVAGITSLNNRVLIGDTTDRGHRLTVGSPDGIEDLTSTTLNNSLLFVGLSNSTDSYGTNFWTEGSGNGFIQQGRTDEEQPRTYNLILQHLGGNVGIGTTDPQYKLHVDGTGYFSGALTANGGLTVNSNATIGGDLNATYLISVGASLEYVELSHATPYIDFHFGNSSDDYTYRIIESESGVLSFSGGLNVAGNVRVSEKIILFGDEPLEGWNNAGTYARWRIVAGAAGIYLQAGNIGGTTTTGSLYLSGINGADLNNLNVLATNSYFNGALHANKGLLIPTGQTLKIGEATISWDGANSVLKVDKDFASDGQVSSGGIAEAASVITGSGLEKMVFTLVEGQTSYECEHNLGTREVTVCIYEEGDDYQQILTDVYLDDTNTARIVFGSVTDINHKVVIVG